MKRAWWTQMTTVDDVVKDNSKFDEFLRERLEVASPQAILETRSLVISLGPEKFRTLFYDSVVAHLFMDAHDGYVASSEWIDKRDQLRRSV